MIFFRAEEVRLSEATFRITLLDVSDVPCTTSACSADDAEVMLRRAGIDDHVLQQILHVACLVSGGDEESVQRDSTVTREGWFVLCKLVGLVQEAQTLGAGNDVAGSVRGRASSSPPSPASPLDAAMAAPRGGDGGGGSERGELVSLAALVARSLREAGGGRPLPLPNFNVAFGPSPPSVPPQPPRTLGRRRRDAGHVPTPPCNEAELQVRLLSPRVRERGPYGTTSFTEYTVYTRTSLPWYPRREITVQRRFSDFEWLHERLRLVFHGTILPPLPPKRWVNNVDADFVRERMEWLARYMARLSQHPRLLSSFELQVMLTASRDGLESAKAIMPAAGQVGGVADCAEPGASNRRGRGVAGAAGAIAAKAVHRTTAVQASIPGTKVLASLWGSVRNVVGLGQEMPPIQVIPTDDDFDKLAATRMGLHRHVGKALEAAEALYEAKRKFAHEAWVAGHSLNLVADACAQFGSGVRTDLQHANASLARDTWSDGATHANAPASPHLMLTTTPSGSWERLDAEGGGRAASSLPRETCEPPMRDNHEAGTGVTAMLTGKVGSPARAKPSQAATPAPVKLPSATLASGDGPDVHRSRNMDEVIATLLGELGARLERFCSVRQSHLDRELEFIEFMRFQKGMSLSEQALIDDRTAAVADLGEATAAVERHRQKVQLTRASAVEGSSRVAAVTEQMQQAEVRRQHAGKRLDSISAWYGRETRWCDAERVRDTKASLLEFVQLQREQAESGAAAVSLRALLDVVKPTDAELKASQGRIQQLLPSQQHLRDRQPSPAASSSSQLSRNSGDASVGSPDPQAPWMADGEEDEFSFLGGDIVDEFM